MDGQNLFDALAGATGHPINRSALNMGIANAQAMNGLRSAQTEEALMKAQQAQEEQKAGDELEGALGEVMGPNRKADAHFAATAMRAKFGNAKEAMDALLSNQQFDNRTILSDVSKLNSPEQTAAQQGIKGEVAQPMEIHPEYATLPGMTPPTVQQTPIGEATTAEHNAQAGLHNAQAAHPELFRAQQQPPLSSEQAAAVAEFIRQNPNLATNMRSLISNGGAQVVQAFLNPGGAPGAPAAPGAPVVPGAQPSATAPANGILPAPGVNLKEQADIRHDFANGVAAKQTSSLNTMVQHSALFDLIADQLNNGNFTPTNAISQAWQKTFGSAVPPNLGIAASFLGREAVRATLNSGSGTGEERELVVDAHSSPDQLHGAAQTLRSLAAGQLHSLELRARRGGVDIQQLLGPEAQTAFGTHNTPAATTPGAIPPQALAQLSEGHITTFGNGQHWTLQGGKAVQVQ